MVTIVILDAIDDSTVEFSDESIPLILQDMLESFLDHLISVLCFLWFDVKSAPGRKSETRVTRGKRGQKGDKEVVGRDHTSYPSTNANPLAGSG